MTSTTHARSFISILIGVFLFSVGYQVNFHLIPVFLAEQRISMLEQEHIELISMLSYVGGALLLSQLINIISSRKLVITSIVLLSLTQASLAFTEESGMISLTMALMAAGSFSYLTLSLIRIVQCFNHYKIYGIITFFLFWSLGYLCGDSLSVALLKLPVQKIMTGEAVILDGLIIICTLFDTVAENNYSLFKMKFSALIENIELQAIGGFVISYIIMSTYWDYEIFAAANNLIIAEVEQLKRVMIISLIIMALPVSVLIINLDKHSLNILFITVLLFSFILWSSLGEKEGKNIIIVSCMVLSLYGISLCNMLILAEKFEGKELRISLAIYFTLSAIGTYTGIVSTNQLVTLLGEKGFIISICSVTGTFLVYYLIEYFKLRKGMKLYLT